MLKKVACTALALCISPVFATEAADNYVGLIGSYVDPDDARDTDRLGYGLDLLLGHVFREWLAVEGRISAEVHDSRQNSVQVQDNYRGAAGVDALFLLGDRQAFSAFVLAGIGASYYDTWQEERDSEAYYYNLGVGLISEPVTEARIRFRAEARFREETYGPDVQDFRIGVGLMLPLGEKPSASTPVVLMPPPAPPKPAPAPAASPSLKGESYPPRPVDMDQDGVLDNFDRCPGTIKGALVDATGCQVTFQSKDLSLDGISFKPGSDVLTAEAVAVLEQVAQALTRLEDKSVTIAGHTDSQGAEDYNLGLSLARATAVKRFLTQNGIAGQRLRVVGFGESQPVADNRTAEGRARNRRVEFRLESGFDPK